MSYGYVITSSKKLSGGNSKVDEAHKYQCIAYTVRFGILKIIKRKSIQCCCKSNALYQ